MTLTTGMRRVVTAMALVGLLAVAPGCGGSEARKERHVEQGKQFLADRNFTKARLEFRNALQIDPKDAEVRALAGFAAENLGQYNDAVKMYRVALAANEDLVLARSRLARIMALAGLPDEAMEILEPGLERSPESPDLLSVRAIAQGQLGDLVAAEQDAERAVKSGPDHAEALAALASVKWQQGNRSDAIALVQRGVKANPSNVDLRLLLVRLLVATEQPALAADQLEEVVRLDPQKTDYRFALAQIYVSQQQVDKALAITKVAAEAKPSDVKSKLTYVQLLAAHRSPEVAEQQLTAYRQESPEDLGLLLAIGRFYEGNGNEQQAEQTYREVIEKSGQKPQGLEALSRLAALKLRAGRADEATKLADQILKSNPSDEEALAVRAEVALRRGDTGSAVADLRAAFGNQPDSVRLAAALARAYVQAGERELAEQTLRSVLQANPRDPQARFALAQFLIQTGDAARARPVIEQLVAEDPSNLLALEGLVNLQLADKDSQAALKTAGMVQALQPRSAKGFILEGEVLASQNQLDAARKAYERAAAADSQSIEPVLALAQLDVTENQPQKALARLDASIERAPENALLHAMRGDVLLSMRRLSEAADSYASAVKSMPGWVKPYRAQATALVAAGDNERAIQALKAGLEETRGSPWLAIDLARLYTRLGQIDGAEQVYERMLERDPFEKSAANNLAMLLVTHRGDQKSLARAGDLVAPFANSANPAYLDTYGWVMFKLGRTEEALVALEKAAEKQPNAKEIRYHLGMAQFKSGRADDARRNLEAATQGDPTYPGVDEARSTLATL